MAAFETIPDGVMAFLRHLNTSTAYERMREIRARERARGESLDGYTLSTGLESYSERTGAYVKDLQVIMKRQQLNDYDGAALAPGSAVLIGPPR